MAKQAVRSSNYYQHNFFNGQFIDQPVSLSRSCKRFDLVRTADSGGGDFVFFLLSFQALQIKDAPVALGLLQNKFDAFPLYMSRLSSAGNNNFTPHIEFKCPFTEFYVNAWGISSADGSVQDVALDLIASNGDIIDYETEPVIVINVG